MKDKEAKLKQLYFQRFLTRFYHAKALQLDLRWIDMNILEARREPSDV
jgi:hypothetical protein